MRDVLTGEEMKGFDHGSRSQAQPEATQPYVGSRVGGASLFFRDAVRTLDDWPVNRRQLDWPCPRLAFDSHESLPAHRVVLRYEIAVCTAHLLLLFGSTLPPQR